MTLKELRYKGTTYLVSEVSFEKLYLYMFDMHHMEMPDPKVQERFIELLTECDNKPG